MLVDYSEHNEVLTITGARLDGGHLQALFKQTDGSGGYYMIPHYSGLVQLTKDYPEAEWTEAAQKLRAKFATLRDDCRSAYTAVQISPEQNFFGFQERTGNMLWHAKHGFVNDDTGLGKTRSVIYAIRDIPGPHLIVCPKIAKTVWVRELAKTVPDWDVLVIDGPAADRRKALALVNQADVVIINYDLLRKHTSYPGWTEKYPGDSEDKELNGVQWGAIVLDEGHRIKDASSIQTRCCWRLADSSSARFVLTATPITKSPEDLWAQLRFINPDEWFAKGKFRDRYLDWVEAPHGGIEILGWKAGMQSEFEAIMGWRTSRRTYNDYDVQRELRDLPEEGPTTVIPLDLLPEQKKLYKQMVDTYLVELSELDKEGFTVAATNVERWIRLRQIASGIPIIDGEGQVRGLQAPSNKLTAVKELIEDVDGPVIVFTEHEKVVSMLHASLRGDARCGLIIGDTPQNLRDSYIDEFQEGRLDILFGTMGAMSEAITLTNAHRLIFAQESTSLRDMIQARGRVRRIGSTIPVPVYVLRSRGTVEIALADGNAEKAGFLDDYLGSPDRYRSLLMGEID